MSTPLTATQLLKFCEIVTREHALTDPQMQALLGSGVLPAACEAAKIDGGLRSVRSSVRKALGLTTLAEALPRPRLRMLVSGNLIPSTATGVIEDRFKNKKLFYRDGSLDSLIRGPISSIGDCLLEVCVLEANSSFVEIVGERLGMAGSPPAELERTFLERKMNFSPEQVEIILRNSGPGFNPFRLRVDGGANFFFILIDGHIVVLHARWRDGGHWVVYAYSFDYAYLWFAGTRVIFGKLVETDTL